MKPTSTTEPSHRRRVGSPNRTHRSCENEATVARQKNEPTEVALRSHLARQKRSRRSGENEATAVDKTIPPSPRWSRPKRSHRVAPKRTHRTETQVDGNADVISIKLVTETKYRCPGTSKRTHYRRQNEPTAPFGVRQNEPTAVTKTKPTTPALKSAKTNPPRSPKRSQ